MSREAARDPLAGALLAVLIHRVNNTTQLVSGVNALLSLDRGDTVLRERAADLAHASETMRESGWLLALVACAEGADLMLARRERDGLAHVARVVAEALRREGRDLARHDRELPELDPGVGRGWELAWSIAGWLWSAGRAVEPRTALEWELEVRGERWELRAAAPFSAELESRMHRVLLPEIGFERWDAKRAPALAFPRAWLATRTRR